MMMACNGDVSDRSEPTMLLGIAASLRNVMPDLIEVYQQRDDVPAIEFTFASSGTIRQQVQGGAPIDAVVLANAAYVDKLIEGKQANSATRRMLASNALVLIGPIDGTSVTFATLSDLPADARIAIGDPESVPAGRYAKRALQNLGVWDAIQDRLVFAGDVAGVLTYTQRNEVDAAIVYHTEVVTAEQVQVFDIAEGQWAPEPQVVATVTTRSLQSEEADAFLAFMASRGGQLILARHGFIPVIDDLGPQESAQPTPTSKPPPDSETFPISLSIRVALFSMLMVTPIGIFLAWVQARRQYPMKFVVDSLILLPLVLPPTVTGFFLITLFGRSGFLGEWLADAFGWQIMFNPIAAIVASSLVALPIVVKTAQPALESVPEALEEVGLTLGLSPLWVFFRVTLPAAWQGITAALVLGFTRAIGEFGATLMFAGNIPGRTNTMPLEIFAAFQAGKQSRVTFYVIVLSIFSVLVVVVASKLSPRRRDS